MKVAIVGGGIVGVTTMYELLRDGHDVLLIDRQPGVALECSHANGGYIAVSQAVPWSAPGVPKKTLIGMLKREAPILLHLRELPNMWRWGLDFLLQSRAKPSWENTRHILRLALFSFEALKETREAAAIDYAIVQKGTLKVYSEAATLEEAIATSETQRQLGLTYRVLTPRECLALVPALEPRLATLSGGIHYPDEEAGDCYAFAVGLAERCRQMGGRFAFDTEVCGLERDGDRIAGVATHTGRIDADAVVIAAGADSPRLVRPLGIRLPIIPVKGYSLTLPRAVWPGAPDMPVLDEKRKFGFAPLGQDWLRTTGFAEIAGFDTTPEKKRTEAFVLAFLSLFPQLGERLRVDELKPFCCLRPVTPAGPPILGRSRYRNLYYNVGQGHLGWTLAHGSARIVAAAVAGRDPGIDLTGYRPAAGM
jgi:D-amino-acid dehydrogenase